MNLPPRPAPPPGGHQEAAAVVAVGAPNRAQGSTPFRLKAADLLPLSVRTDAAAARRAFAHLGAIVAAGTVQWTAAATWWVVPSTILLGYLLAFLFTLEHETAHQTAFRTRAWNHVLGHLAGFAILLPYEYYRAFHWDHHRYTQDPQRDPELAVPLPRSRAGFLWVWFGVPTWTLRLKLLFRHGLLGRVGAPWVPPEKRALIVREARTYLAGYLLILAASVLAGSMAAVRPRRGAGGRAGDRGLKTGCYFSSISTNTNS
jgi:fatty acid desaturase